MIVGTVYDILGVYKTGESFHASLGSIIRGVSVTSDCGLVSRTLVSSMVMPRGVYLTGLIIVHCLLVTIQSSKFSSTAAHSSSVKSPLDTLE
jgi:hypothetical protein